MEHEEGFSLQVTVTIDPANVEKYMDFFKPCYDLVIAEPECTFFEVYQSSDNPGELHWVENWSKSPQWFLEVQSKKPYYKPYLQVTEPMWIKPREVKIYNRVNPYFYVAALS
ncbi:hypothetical protein TrVFT333_007907 [Trichoderma virens FT-333]|nr:hypothetical protein TrVFT333_007907 [Trichoderma virens FT-333]